MHLSVSFISRLRSYCIGKTKAMYVNHIADARNMFLRCLRAWLTTHRSGWW